MSGNCSFSGPTVSSVMFMLLIPVTFILLHLPLHAFLCRRCIFVSVFLWQQRPCKSSAVLQPHSKHSTKICRNPILRRACLTFLYRDNYRVKVCSPCCVNLGLNFLYCCPGGLEPLTVRASPILALGNSPMPFPCPRMPTEPASRPVKANVWLHFFAPAPNSLAFSAIVISPAPCVSSGASPPSSKLGGIAEWTGASGAETGGEAFTCSCTFCSLSASCSISSVEGRCST